MNQQVKHLRLYRDEFTLSPQFMPSGMYLEVGEAKIHCIPRGRQSLRPLLRGTFISDRPQRPQKYITSTTIFSYLYDYQIVPISSHAESQLLTQNLVHRFSFCQLVDQFIEVANFLHGWFFDVFHADPTDHTSDQSSRRI